jgi:N-acetylglucosamine-6-phosphate deacetylase
LRNLVNVIGLDLEDAVRRVSTYPADFLGLPERGRLAPGAWADVVVLDRDLAVQEVFVEGGAIDVAHAG